MRRALLGMFVVTLGSAWLVGAAAAATGPVVVGATSSAGALSGTTSVAVSGNYAYAASYWSGQLNVIDIATNPAAPTVVGSTTATSTMIGATNVTIAGGYAFVTAKNSNGPCVGPPNCLGFGGSNDNGDGNSLTVVNISSPTAPSVVGTVQSNSTTTPFPDSLFGAYAVAVSGNYAFVASQGLLSGQPTAPDSSEGTFTVIDLTTPSSPTIVASIDNSALSGGLANGLDHATGVAISGQYAYVTAFYGQRLTTIDISNPLSPSVVASVHDTTNLADPNDVTTQGSYAYVANQVGTGGMQFTVLNISNPFVPAVVGEITDPTLVGAYRLRVSGNFAYVSGNGASSVAAIDISNPSVPRLAGAVTDARLNNVDGLAIDSTGRHLVATSPRLPAESGVTYPPYPLAGGPTNTGTVSVIDLEPVPLSVSVASGPANGTTSTSANITFDVSDTVTTLSCSLDGAAAVPCPTGKTGTTASYSSLGVGTHTVGVTATNPTGQSAQATYTWTITTPPPPTTTTTTTPPPSTSAPVNTSAPVLSGTAQQGQLLSVGKGVWSGSPTSYSARWERCNAQGTSCRSISGVTTHTYTVTLADVGSTLRGVVTATNSRGSTSAPSGATATVRWSSAGFASATLSSSKTSKPRINLSVPSPGGGLKLAKLVMSLPKGLSFAGTKKALAAGISVKDLHGKRLAIAAALSHGKLTLTFKKPQTGLKLTVARGLVSISSALSSRIKSRKAKSEKLSLTLDYKGKPNRQGAVKFRLA